VKSEVIREDAPVKEVILTLTPGEFEMVYQALYHATPEKVPGHVGLFNLLDKLRNTL